jgi:hypothetical protein
MSNITPPIGAKGVYTLALPWVTVANTQYTCIAVREFQDLIQQGVDIVNVYYTPMGLSTTDYQADLAAGAKMITLAGVDQPTIYVPDSHITAYPDQSSAAYNNVVLSFSFGPLPDGLDLSFAIMQLSANASDTIGLAPTVTTHVAPTTGVITAAQALILETNRQAAITSRTTDHAKVLSQQVTIDALNAQIATLESIVIAAGLLPAPAPAPSP